MRERSGWSLTTRLFRVYLPKDQAISPSIDEDHGGKESDLSHDGCMMRMRRTKKENGPSRRKVWLYVADGKYAKDLARLDAEGFDTWAANRLTRSGDLILMYRTAPFSDIAYVFVAKSDARRMSKWHWNYAVDLADGYRLQRVIRLDELRKLPQLRHWSFLRYSQGAMKYTKDLQGQGVWRPLQQLLERRAPGLRKHFGKAWTGRGRRRHVFVSYSSRDRRKIQGVYTALANRGIDVWLDRVELPPGVDFDKRIDDAIRLSRAVIVCLSKAWLRSRGYVKKTELERALQYARGRRDFVFPVRLEGCSIPIRLKKFQAADLFGARRNNRLDSLVARIR